MALTVVRDKLPLIERFKNFLDTVKNFFDKKGESNIAKKAAVQSMAKDVIAKPKTALQLAQEQIYQERQKRYLEKIENMGKVYTERLNEHLNTYFSNFSDDLEMNQIAYNLLNKEWKSYVQKCNATQSKMQLRHDAFEVEVAGIIAKNPQFQPKDTITDLTKLNESI